MNAMIQRQTASDFLPFPACAAHRPRKSAAEGARIDATATSYFVVYTLSRLTHSYPLSISIPSLPSPRRHHVIVPSNSAEAKKPSHNRHWQREPFHSRPAYLQRSTINALKRYPGRRSATASVVRGAEAGDQRGV